MSSNKPLALAAALALAALPAFADIQPLLGVGSGGGSGGGSYTPPLDPVGQSGVSRAYSTCRLFSAYSSTLIAVTTIGGSTTNYSATPSGCVDWSAIASQCSTATSCSVIFKDQSGNGSDTTQGAACSSSTNCVLIDPTNHWVNINNPTAQGNYLAYTDAAQSQPYAIVVNDNHHADLSSNQLWTGSGVNASLAMFGGKATIYAGAGNVSVSIANNTWYALSAVFNGSSSSIAVNNGTPGSGNAGTGTITASTSGIGSNPSSATYYSDDTYLDTFVIFKGNPGSTALSNFVTWLRAHEHV